MRMGFWTNQHGGVAPILALSIVPIVGALATSVDYSWASMTRAELQSALDSALLLAARGDGNGWDKMATNAFHALASTKNATIDSVTFTKDSAGNFVGEVAAQVPMKFAGMLGKSSLSVNASAAVKAGGGSDDSCILTLDKEGTSSHASMVFNGAPNIALTGCSIRSNTSLRCNGHGGGGLAAFAVGNATGCDNPRSGERALPDIYEAVAEHISPVCGGLNGGATWTPGVIPSAIKTVHKATHTEYHVCGDLTLSGNGMLTGGAGDSVIVVENGSVKMADHAVIQTTRTAIVLTGNNGLPSALEFPNGNGKKATLSLSPPQDASNPWRGIALYQDPKLTRNVDHSWGPGASLSADGLIYLPNSDVEMRGVAASNNDKCTKIVTGNFRTNGAVDLSFSQKKEGCTKIGMKQWADTPLHIVR